MRNAFRKIKYNIKAFFAIKNAQNILEKYLNKPNGKKILLVSQQLTTTGSPFMLYHLASKLKEQGFSPLVLSYAGGSLTSAFKKLGIDVILGEVFENDKPAFKNIAKHFDKIIVNTIVCYSVVEEYNDAIWWIHEGKNVAGWFMQAFPTLKETLKKAKNIFVVSDYAKSIVEEFNPNIKITTLGVEDYFNETFKKQAGSRIKFALVGDVCLCKGQDILVDAIKKMDEKYLNQSEFHFFCKKKGSHYRQIADAAKNLKNVFFDGLFTNQEEKWKAFSNMDVFLIPSRDESCSLVALEACMLKKPIIISENVGAKYMIDCTPNGYIVESENPEALKDAIQKLLDNKDNLEKMGEVSRKMYEEKANFEIFTQQLQKIIDECKV